jgi:hypothetical protein
LGEKDLPSLVKPLMAENEEQGRDMNRMERWITELDVCKEGFKKEEDDGAEGLEEMVLQPGPVMLTGLFF